MTTPSAMMIMRTSFDGLGVRHVADESSDGPLAGEVMPKRSDTFLSSLFVMRHLQSELNDPPLQADHGGIGPILGAQFWRERSVPVPLTVSSLKDSFLAISLLALPSAM